MKTSCPCFARTYAKLRSSMFRIKVSDDPPSPCPINIGLMCLLLPYAEFSTLPFILWTPKTNPSAVSTRCSSTWYPNADERSTKFKKSFWFVLYLTYNMNNYDAISTTRPALKRKAKVQGFIYFWLLCLFLW